MQAEHDESTVRRLHVQPVPEPVRSQKAPEPPPTPVAPPAPLRSSLAFETALAVIQAGAFALSARVLLLIALVGAFALAWQAMGSQTLASLAVLTIYGVLTIPALTYLELRRGRSGP